MKAQFKYAFLNGIYIRGPVFIIIFIMNFLFIILGSLGLLPFAAHVTAVSLGGAAITLMLVVNIIGDVLIIRSVFSAPGAYLQALTPTPRWKILFISVIIMTLMDLFSMAFVIGSEFWLSYNMIGMSGYDELLNIVRAALEENPTYLRYVLLGILMFLAAYLLVLSIVLFCVTAKKSFLYKMPASGILAFLLACLCLYFVSLSQLLLAPFGIVEIHGIFIIITLGPNVIFPIYFLLLLMEASALFVVTSKLIEKRINI